VGRRQRCACASYGWSPHVRRRMTLLLHRMLYWREWRTSHHRQMVGLWTLASIAAEAHVWRWHRRAEAKPLGLHLRRRRRHSCHHSGWHARSRRKRRASCGKSASSESTRRRRRRREIRRWVHLHWPPRSHRLRRSMLLHVALSMNSIHLAIRRLTKPRGRHNE
jgi:hypothetical protein